MAVASAQAPAPDPMFRAMHDEMERSRKLTLPNLEAPYFVEYLVDEAENFSVSASLGGLVARRHERFREPEVQVRVGDYKFDNSNYAGGGFAFGSRYDLERFPAGGLLPACCAATSGWRPIRRTSRRWKPSPASGRRCATSRRASSSTISRTPSRCTTCRAFHAPGHRRRGMGQPRARALGDFRAVSRGEELQRWSWNPATAASTW